MLNQKTLRTAKLQKKYMAYLDNHFDRSCIFCSKEMLVKEYKYWVIIKNRFPYDNVFKDHRLLAPKAHIKERTELSAEELEEFEDILKEVSFDMLIYNNKAKQSVPAHYHLHLTTLK